MSRTLYIAVLLVLSIFSRAAIAESCETAIGWDQPGTAAQCDSARSSGANEFIRTPGTSACADLGITVNYQYTAKAYRCDCPAAGTNKSSGYYDWGTSDAALPATTACDGGCETSYSGGGIDSRRMVNGVYHYYSQGSYDYTGQTCSGGTQSPNGGNLPPNTCDPATQQSGQVNGQNVCLPKSQTNTSSTSTSPTTTDPATGNTSSTSTTTTNNTTNNTTTTTTIVTTTAPDGTQTQEKSETTTKNPPSSFCAANPTDPTCVKQTDACEKNPDLIGCHTMGTAPLMEAIPTKTLAVDSTVTPVGNGGMCPSPASLSFMGQSLTWSYQPVCDFASMIRPLVIGLAWLSFGVIVVGGVRK